MIGKNILVDIKALLSFACLLLEGLSTVFLKRAQDYFSVNSATCTGCPETSKEPSTHISADHRQQKKLHHNHGINSVFQLSSSCLPVFSLSSSKADPDIRIWLQVFHFVGDPKKYQRNRQKYVLNLGDLLKYFITLHNTMW